MAIIARPRRTWTPSWPRAPSFSQCYSPHIPTTPGYTSMFTGLDCFGMDVVALRHEGGLRPEMRCLSEILGDEGYNTTCVGFSGNPASRGFQKYIDFSGWGSWDTGRSPKAENLNEVTIPELKRLAGEDQRSSSSCATWTPHSPYLPPRPFERIFYDGNELDPDNDSLDEVYNFKPFCDYFASWFPPGCTDKDYVIAQYDGAIAYMDACIQNIFTTLSSLGLEEDTLVVITSDHGETLHDHACWYDHHGIYDNTLHIPLAYVWPGHIAPELWYDDIVQQKDTTPTILDLMGVDTGINYDGRSLVPLFEGLPRVQEPEFYITEATWMRKHGWRTPQWKYMHALEPDFHFKPEIELYNLLTDPEENNNVAAEEPGVCAFLEARMQAHIAKREKETGRTNPMYTNLNWNGQGHPFTSSEEAYNTMHIGSPDAAKNMQELRTQRGAAKL